jgi:hypothetical protein
MKTKEKKRFVYPVDLTEVKEELALITERMRSSKVEAIREAIKHYAGWVKGLEVIEYKGKSQLSKPEAKKLILDYLRGKDKAYSCDIADELGIEPGYVEECLSELWKEDKAEEVK